MIYRNEDEFSKDLRESVRGTAYAEKLKDKSIPVELLLEEITLIDWALCSFKREPIYEAVRRALESAADLGVSFARIETPFREAFDLTKQYDMVMERLRGKLCDAVNTKLEQDGNQPEFKF